MYVYAQVSCKSCKTSKKTIGKIMWTKFLLKSIIVGYNLSVNFLYKRIFFLWFFHCDHNQKADNEIVLLILNVNRGPRVTYSWMTLSKGEEHVCCSFAISWTCKEILWSFKSIEGLWWLILKWLWSQFESRWRKCFLCFESQSRA